MHTGADVDPPLPLPDPGKRAVAAQRSAYSSVLLIGLAVALGTALRSFGPPWAKQVFKPLDLNSPDRFAACLLALFASVILHECGHLIASVLFRFEVTSVSLGPFRFSRPERRWTLQLTLRRFFQGAIASVPRNQRSWRLRMLMVVAAGPAVTGLTGLVAWRCVTQQTAESGSGFFEALLQLNFLLLMLGFVPSPLDAARPNDARLFLALLRFDSQARSILLYHLVTMFRLEGRRPRQYPEWIMRRIAVVDAAREMHAFFAQTIADWALDRGDLSTADAWLQHFSAFVSGFDSCPANIVAHSACLDLILRDDARSAARRLSDISIRALTPKWFRHRCSAVQALAAGNVQSTLAELCRAEYHFPAADLPYFSYERMLLGRLRLTAKELTLSNAVRTRNG